jgi:hypothetical protein
MDKGSKVIGVCAMTNGKVLYQSEVYLREDVSGKIQHRQCIEEQEEAEN